VLSLATRTDLEYKIGSNGVLQALSQSSETLIMLDMTNATNYDTLIAGKTYSNVATGNELTFNARTAGSVTATYTYKQNVLQDYYQFIEGRRYTYGTTSSILEFYQNGTFYVNSGDSAKTPGKNSGMILLTDSTDYFRLITTDAYNLTGLNLPSILEMDYNSDVVLFIGLFANTPTGVKQIPLFNAFPTKGWNKAYINLTDEVAINPVNTEYKVYIDVYRSKGSPRPRIIIDNVKLIEG
jgi:hypothetical protein